MNFSIKRSVILLAGLALALGAPPQIRMIPRHFRGSLGKSLSWSM